MTQDANNEAANNHAAVAEGVDTGELRELLLNHKRAISLGAQETAFAELRSYIETTYGAQQREAGRREAAVPKPIECLREAMGKANVPTDYRPYLVGHFSNAWNSRLPAPYITTAAPPAKAEGMSGEVRLKAARWDALRCNWECNYDRKGKEFQFFYNNRGELSGSAKSYNDIPDLESVVDAILAQQAKGEQQ